MGVQILGTGSYAPDNVVRQRGPGQPWACDPAVDRAAHRHSRAAARSARDGHQRLLRRGRPPGCSNGQNVSPDDIDLVVVGTFTPDCQVASTAAMVQDRLGYLCGRHRDFIGLCGFHVCPGHGGPISSPPAAASKALVDRRRLQLADCRRQRSRRSIRCSATGPGPLLLAPGSPEQGLAGIPLGADGSGAEMLYKEMGGSRVPASHEAIDARLATCCGWTARACSNGPRGAVTTRFAEVLAARSNDAGRYRFCSSCTRPTCGSSTRRPTT